MPSGWLDAKLVPLAKSIGDNRLCFHGEPGRACSTCRRNTEMCAHGSFRWACRSCNARTMPERLSACSDWTRNTLPRYDWTTAPWIERQRNNFATNTAVSANSAATNSASANKPCHSFSAESAEPICVLAGTKGELGLPFLRCSTVGGLGAALRKRSALSLSLLPCLPLSPVIGAVGDWGGG